jgi:hypothetical protein
VFSFIILKFCIHTFQNYEILDYHNNITLKNIEMLVQYLYEKRNEISSFANSSSSSASSAASSRPASVDQQRLSVESFSSSAYHDDLLNVASSSSSASSSSLMIFGSLPFDTLVDTLSFIWKTLAFFIKLETSSLPSSSSTSSSSSSFTSHNQKLKELFSLFQTSLVLSHSFNIIAFLTGIVRCLSNDEIHRKRLFHYHLLKILLEEGFKIYLSSYVKTILSYPLLLRKEMKDRKLSRLTKKGQQLDVTKTRKGEERKNQERIHGTKEVDNGEEDALDDSNELTATIEDDEEEDEETFQSNIFPSRLIITTFIDKLLASLLQMIGIYRNFSFDKLSRQYLLEQKLLKRLFSLLSFAFIPHYPDLILNITRVLAKLSLYEGFRYQITNDLNDLEVLVNLIQKEAKTCQFIMDRSEEEVEEGKDDERKRVDGWKQPEGKEKEKEERKTKSEENTDFSSSTQWPQWYTWPMISRIAYTLGNLTTTNETNRTMIGSTFHGSSSILLLLQVCSNSLKRIQDQKKQKQLMDDHNVSCLLLFLLFLSLSCFSDGLLPVFFVSLFLSFL